MKLVTPVHMGKLYDTVAYMIGILGTGLMAMLVIVPVDLPTHQHIGTAPDYLLALLLVNFLTYCLVTYHRLRK